MSSSTSPNSWRRDRDDRGVWTLWFDQPGRSYNVLDRAALDELDSHLAEAGSRPRRSPVASSAVGSPGASARGPTSRPSSPAGRRPRSKRCSGAGWPYWITSRRSDSPRSHSSTASAWVADWSWPWPAGGASHSPRRRHSRSGCRKSTSAWYPRLGRHHRPPQADRSRRCASICSCRADRIGFLRARSLGIVDRLAAEGDPAESFETLASAHRRGGIRSEEDLAARPGSRACPAPRPARRTPGRPGADPLDRRAGSRRRTGSREAGGHRGIRRTGDVRVLARIDQVVLPARAGGVRTLKAPPNRSRSPDSWSDAVVSGE